MEPIPHNAIVHEVERAALGDSRLNDRLQKIVTKIREAPEASFPKLFTSSELEAAYRFFSNERVQSESIVKAHSLATQARIRERAGVVLAIHDTSAMSFGKECPREGLGPLRGKRSSQGFYSHVTVSVCPGEARIPLGCLGMTAWVRPKGGKKKAMDTRESARWYQQVEQSEKDVGEPGRLIHVMDREADDYGLFARMQEAGYRFIIRLRHNRVIQGNDGAREKLYDRLEEVRCRVTRTVAISRRKKGGLPIEDRIHPPRDARIAQLAMGTTTVEIRHPKLQAKKRRGPPTSVELPKTVKLNVVDVWELDPPPGETPISWRLLTTESITTPQDLEHIVDGYRSRWVIEDYFKALKTGCAYLSRQLERFHALKNCLAVYLPIAYQLLLLRSLSRCDDDVPAETVLAPTQLQVLKTFSRRPLSAHPSAREAFWAIASLGGHIKYNGSPGWLTLQRGYEELIILCRGWCAAEVFAGKM